MLSHDSKHYFGHGHHQTGPAPPPPPPPQFDNSTSSYAALLPPADLVGKSEPGVSPSSYYMPAGEAYPSSLPRRDADSGYSVAAEFAGMVLPDAGQADYSTASGYDPVPAPDMTRPVSAQGVRPTHCPERELSMYKNKMETKLCDVCEDTAAGFHCGAFVCEACKKFFIRSWKAENNQRYQCTKNETCRITKDTRTHCQRCRYKKCIALKMVPPNMRPTESPDISAIPCRVCGAQSSGFHFGAITCEGCKGFFRRTIHERTNHPYTCSKSGNCVINTQTRNNCKSCRFIKCVNVGMSKNGSRIGRQPNAIKHLCGEEIRAQRQHRQRQQAQAQAQAKAVAEASISPYPVSPVLTQQDSAFRLAGYRPDNPDVLPPPLLPAAAAAHKPDEVPEVTSSVCPVTAQARSADPGPEFLPSDSWPIKKFRSSLVDATQYLFVTNGHSVRQTITDNMSIKEVLARMMKRFHDHAVTVVNYAKNTPDFQGISSEYQTLLVKEAMYSIMMIKLSADYDPLTGDFNYFDYTREERDIILRHFPSFKGICDHLKVSGQLIKPCNLDDVELALLCYVEFISGEKIDPPAKNDPVIFKRLHQRALDALDDYVMNDRPTSCLQGTKLLEIQSQLSCMNAEHRQIVKALRVDAEQDNMGISFSDLYIEIFRLSEEMACTQATPSMAPPHIDAWIDEERASQSEADSTTRELSAMRVAGQPAMYNSRSLFLTPPGPGSSGGVGGEPVSTTRDGLDGLCVNDDWI